MSSRVLVLIVIGLLLILPLGLVLLTDRSYWTGLLIALGSGAGVLAAGQDHAHAPASSLAPAAWWTAFCFLHFALR